MWATSLTRAETTARDPLPGVPKTLGSDFAIYIQVPRDVLDEWLARTHSNTRKMPLDAKLRWLKNHVEADIRICTADYRLKADLTLGKVFKDCSSGKGKTQATGLR